MFMCQYCHRSYTRKDNLKRHGDCRVAVKICDSCGMDFGSERVLQHHRREQHQALKRSATKSPTPMAKRARLNQQEGKFKIIFNMMDIPSVEL